MGGEHSSMDKEGTADISPSARFGVKESFVTEKLYNGLVELYKIEAATEWEEPSSCQLIWSMINLSFIWFNLKFIRVSSSLFLFLKLVFFE